jgi:hypothetical protein
MKPLRLLFDMSELVMREGPEGPHVLELKAIEEGIVSDVVHFYRSQERSGMTFRTLWPVDPRCGKSMYLGIIASYADRFGGPQLTSLSYAPKDVSAPSIDDFVASANSSEFSYLKLSKPGASFVLRTVDATPWSPDNGWMGIVSWKDMSDLTYELFSLTAAQALCGLDTFKQFYAGSALILPDGQTPSLDQTESRLVERK